MERDECSDENQIIERTALRALKRSKTQGVLRRKTELRA
jgi:hypothetical protein